MQLFLGAVPIILRLFSKARGHLLFSNYSRNNLPKPMPHSTGRVIYNFSTCSYMQRSCSSIYEAILRLFTFNFTVYVLGCYIYYFKITHKVI